MAAFGSSIVASSLAAVLVGFATDAPNQVDSTVATMRAAIACSDRQLEVLAKGSDEEVERIALAAIENCHVLWQRAATTSAGDRSGSRLEDFAAGFLAAARARYPDHARPLALRWRSKA